MMTTESKHTAGPWTVGRESYNACMVYSHYDGVCQVFGLPMNVGVNDVGPEWAEGLANARLIAAAPDMYEALDRLMRIIASDDPWDREHVDDMNEACDAARTAISKAKGEA